MREIMFKTMEKYYLIPKTSRASVYPHSLCVILRWITSKMSTVKIH